jgi:hypothetical protein
MVHIPVDLKRPAWVSGAGDGTFLVSNSSRRRICLLDPAARSFSVLIELKRFGVSRPANCLFDGHGLIWVNDPDQRRLWVFTRRGALLRMLGDGGREGEAGHASDPAPVPHQCPLEEMRLDAVYDMRKGTDGLMYILEGARFRLRAIDFERNTVRTVAGSGAHGYSGDGGDPLAATFGSKRRGNFDGPWAFCMDDRGAIFIADTQNHAVRMIDSDRARIRTIAGGRPQGGAVRNDPRETDPCNLTLPSPFWMDWGEGFLFVSDECGDLVVLKEQGYIPGSESGARDGGFRGFRA